jgi:hypothetical protein
MSHLSLQVTVEKLLHIDVGIRSSLQVGKQMDHETCEKYLDQLGCIRVTLSMLKCTSSLLLTLKKVCIYINPLSATVTLW